MESANPLRAGLTTERIPAPCAVVIFGAAGDLTKRKLVPALYNLAVSRLLPAGFSVVGVGRHAMSDDEFRAAQRESVARFSRRKPIDDVVWNDFAQGMTHVAGTFEDPATFAALRERLDEVDRTRGTRGNRVFYLSTPPSVFGTIVEQLARAGLVADPKDASRFSRVVCEKPHGTDLTSSRALDRELHAALAEDQIYRIDHYLGKEAVQNLLAFRFANSIFEPLWNRRHIDHVQITVAEDIGVEGRGRFYESAGALRDIVQNHLIQLVTLFAMEPPVGLGADAVRDEKVKVLRALRPVARADVGSLVVRGQYGPGGVAGAAVPGYRQEPDVSPESRTETYVAMRMEVDSWRWGAVPFYIRAGKRLAKKVTDISVHFRPVPQKLFPGMPDACNNVLTLRIQPDEGIALRFAAKVPGAHGLLRPVAMDFRYGATFGGAGPEAYERLLLDVMLGDATLFTRADEVDESWRFFQPVLDAWAEAPAAFPNYPAGSWGPSAADELLARDGRRWRTL